MVHQQKGWMETPSFKSEHSEINALKFIIFQQASKLDCSEMHFTVTIMTTAVMKGPRCGG